jgi:sugar-phosphatase
VLRAAIFDMDGVLIDSEPIWRAAEIAVFGAIGVQLTEDDCRSTMGLRVDEVVDHWRRLRPWDDPPPAEVVDRVLAAVVDRIRRTGEPLPGVAAALDACAERGLRLALATSSWHPVVTAVLDRLAIADRFEVVHSAQDEPRGKPDPGVYRTTAARLGVDPRDCVAIEDSPNGVRSAVAAGMRCVAVPEAGTDVGEIEAAGAEVVLPSLDAFPAWLTTAFSTT